ncbi:hypothetical protein J1614_007444 [Plenodomus biglobosus]|nr:hypothetical protein J1614_007444 [Plenodomus biglobosus]
MECSWMKGFVFNSESVVPDTYQLSVLRKPESWYKTQPGVLPFPGRNIPIRYFSKISAIADENAAAQGHTQSDDEEIDPSPDSESEEAAVVSSPQSTPKITHNDEPRTSQMSWSASPSPEPPQRPASIKPVLPPDSSLETGQPVESSKITRTLSPAFTTPAKEKEPSAPPSSPPVIETPADPDNEIEMELSVPQALGEDATRAAHGISSCREIPGSQSTQSQPVVHVRETPHSKSRHIQVSSRATEHAAATKPRSRDMIMIDSPPNAEGQVEKLERSGVPECNVEIPKVPSRMSVSGPIKRKLAESPTNSGRPQSKRRELKIVGFGSDSPPSTDPTLALRKDRADSLQRFREARKSNTSYESRTVSANNTNADQVTEAMNIDTPDTTLSKPRPLAMSPRHQSLYDEPSPPRPLPPLPSPHPSSAVAQSPRKESTSANVDRPVPMVPEPSTVFDQFRAAYPEYIGNEKHFKGQCLQMYQLDEEDKMVPKWQWDDYIIRHKSDYRQYLMDCLDDGEEPEPYHRFYKDTIRDTLYKKGIVGSRKTLLKALEELDSEPPAPFAEEPRQRKPLWTSLPSVPSQHKRTSGYLTPEVPRQRSHHLLPISSRTNQRTAIPSSHTSAFRPPTTPASTRIPTWNLSSSPHHPAQNPKLPSRLSLGSTPRVSDTLEGTGDPFRDYFFAVQRAKSLTGSDTVSPVPNAAKQHKG